MLADRVSPFVDTMKTAPRSAVGGSRLSQRDFTDFRPTGPKHGLLFRDEDESEVGVGSGGSGRGARTRGPSQKNLRKILRENMNGLHWPRAFVSERLLKTGCGYSAGPGQWRSSANSCRSVSPWNLAVSGH